MNGKVVASVPIASSLKPAAGKDKRPNLAKTRLGVSRDAQRVAVAILEVLAGVRTPTEAAKALGLVVPRYYLWEQRALEGLVRACEPRPVGKAASDRHQLAVLEKEVIRLRQECVRQQALARAAQRTIALAAAAPAAKAAAKAVAKSDTKTDAKAGEGGKAKRKRRPVVRALKMAAALQQPAAEASAADPSSPPPDDVVQRSVADSCQAAAETVPAAAQSPV
jgi:hypothetical protein